MSKFAGFTKGLDGLVPLLKEDWHIIAISAGTITFAIGLKSYLNRRRQRRFREIYKFSEDVNFKIKAKHIEITSGFNALKKFVDNKESLEDFFGTRIHAIEKESRKYRCDLIKLHTEPFKLYRVNQFSNLDYTKVYGAISYKGKQVLLDQQDFSTILFVGIQGSGKTAAAMANMEYSAQSNMKAGRRVKKIIITPKTSDFKGYVDSDDELFTIKTLEDYERLISLFEEASEHTLNAINKNKLPEIFYIFFLDEILIYLASGKELDKKIGMAKLRLAGIVEEFARLTARAGRQLLMAGTQDPSVGSCLVKSKFFALKFIGRVETIAQAQVFNFGAELLDSSLKKGVFYNSVTREKVRFPLMSKFKEVE